VCYNYKNVIFIGGGKFMTLVDIICIIGGVGFLAIIIGTVIYVKKITPSKEEQDAEIDKYFENNGEIVESRAEVIDMSCGTDMVGGKTAKSVRWFKIKFEKYDGEIIEVPVDEEMYEGIEVGMRGNLRLVDGHLNSFELD
jgi:hypothetical protein